MKEKKEQNNENNSSEKKAINIQLLVNKTILLLLSNSHSYS